MLLLEFKIVTQSGRMSIVLDKSGVLKCFIKAAPEKGKANEEVIELIAKSLKIAKGSVEIVAGWTSRKKVIKIQTSLTYEEFLHKIGFGVQKTIL